ncbi:U1 small nuclear ribonucleoprotein 70 kDa [Strongylocentrotus purpuratus]|uniref:U1 small nuclear ribonucleoprotein 70 kDa n=1 Tax=Strongylocentrotus purpuratus TaxID=7668 RepID=A0A7M7R9J0_STRPU|nr:U1 small nuclear ribonucleoprotein 70 kDa [Strongylocentrotus purpuratus]
MTQYLPPNLLALFAPREPIRYLPPLDKLPEEKRTDGYSGISSYVQLFEDPADTPPPARGETREEKRLRKMKEKEEMCKQKLENEVEEWDAHSNASATSNAFKTLFIARVNYDTTESKLRREFESYGPIKMISIAHDINTGKPKGYAFIEYAHERDMHSAYKYADGKKIDSRRVLVDVERARTVKGWTPRRLGGGLGGTRRGGPDVNSRHSGRDDPSGNREREREREREDEESDRRERDEPERDREEIEIARGDVTEGIAAIVGIEVIVVTEVIVGNEGTTRQRRKRRKRRPRAQEER